MKRSIYLFVMLFFSVTAVFAGEHNHQHETKQAVTNTKAVDHSSLKANEVLMEVHGIVCSFCSQGVKRKLAKFTFIDRDRLNKGIIMDIENQKITIAIKEGETPDIQAMFKAILSGGYEPVSAVTLDANGNQVLVKAES